MPRQHIHKYRRINIGRDKEYWVMQCQASGCSHYYPMKSKRSCPGLVGKTAICNSCSGFFELDKRSIDMAKPTCFSCVDSDKRKRLIAAGKFLSGLDNIEEAK